ncbi:hypothetical protein ACN94_14340 [Gordonia paraffinivorans]|nr:hypothetical protein [Gordonia paraffinivorans]
MRSSCTNRRSAIGRNELVGGRFGPTPPGRSETMHGAVHGLDNLYVVNASFPPARWAWSAQR